MATKCSSDNEANPLLSEDPFKSERSQKLFEAIEELRSCGANHHVELPELVIVGDQSVGKSSLLQSLTDIPFPVAGRLCTRFPTLILSRRTPNKPETTRISIEAVLFNHFTSESHQTRVDRYAQFTRESSHITAADFVALVKEAGDLMGISETLASVERKGKAPSAAECQNFSNDILKIEISGPTRSYFSIVDVPGVFQSLTKDLTESEKIGVKNMVASYMSRKQSVIVCVASGTNDLANQAAFDMASFYDRNGSRTVGVITKCDVAQDLDQVLELALNREKQFDHGWFVVRNRTPSEAQEGLEPLERHSREKSFFDTQPWNKLEESRRGTQPLKKYLAALLCSRIQEAFPNILSSIRTQQDSVQSALDSLGAPRKTVEQKRTYLTTIAQHYHAMASQALRGRYDVISTSDMRLRMRVRQYNDDFALDMKEHGHSTPFIQIQKIIYNSSSGSERKLDSKTSTPQPLEASTNGGIFGGFGNLSSISSSERYKNQSHEELRLSDYLQAQSKTSTASSGAPKSVESAFGNATSGLFGGIPQTTTNIQTSFGQPVSHSGDFNTPAGNANIQAKTMFSPAEINRGQSQIYQWIRSEVKASRGTELQGTLNPDVLPALFHRQASNWRAKSEAHFLKVQNMAMSVTERLVETTCSDQHTRAQIRTVIQRANKRATGLSLNQLSDRLHDILTKHLQTNNQAFEDKISEARLLRFQGALERYRSSRKLLTGQAFGASLNTNGPDTQFIIDMQDTAALFAELHMSNSQNLEDEIHDTLKSYYEVALNDFVEYVTQLVVERYLNDSEGPLLMFSPIYVGGMNDQAVENLAAEDDTTTRRRAEKEETLARLTRAEEIAMKYTL